MFIQTENTPNPSTLKFIPEKSILKKGNFEFKSKLEAKISPLAMKLFENEDVKNVFFGIDFITITKSEAVDWEIIKPDILSKIMNFFFLQAYQLLTREIFLRMIIHQRKKLIIKKI